MKMKTTKKKRTHKHHRNFNHIFMLNRYLHGNYEWTKKKHWWKITNQRKIVITYTYTLCTLFDVCVCSLASFSNVAINLFQFGRRRKFEFMIVIVSHYAIVERSPVRFKGLHWQWCSVGVGHMCQLKSQKLAMKPPVSPNWLTKWNFQSMNLITIHTWYELLYTLQPCIEWCCFFFCCCSTWICKQMH